MRTQAFILKYIVMLLIAASFIYLTACEKEPETPQGNNKIMLSEPTVDQVAYNWMVLTGLASSDIPEYTNPEDHGFCWSTAPNPDLNQSVKSLGKMTGLGSYSARIDGLADNTKYYFRAYAIMKEVILYSPAVEITTLQKGLPKISTDNVTDIQENSASISSTVISDGSYMVTSRGVCWNTNGNPTLQNCLGFTTDGQGMGSLTSAITGLNSLTIYYVRAYATNSEGTAYGNQLNFTTAAQSWSCGLVLTIDHTDSNIAPVSKTVNYGTIETNLTGSSKCWITQNLGADHQATSATDMSEASAGWYWQFNLKRGYKHDGTTRIPNTTWISNISESSDWLPANDPCTLILGSGWRIPTSTEWQIADAYEGWDNYDETFASLLKLHASGYLVESLGSLNGRGSIGVYWSNSQHSADLGFYLGFYSGECYLGPNGKAFGNSLRCLKD